LSIPRDFGGSVEIDVGPLKARRHHADDFVRLMDQSNGAADHVRIAEEIALPEFVTQNDHRLGIAA
jgi:hypothetical protein